MSPQDFPSTPAWYEQIAIAIGDATAVRAVGRANGLNRIAILIPWHRVVNKNGELGGYGGGLRRKQYLLDLERSFPARTKKSPPSMALPLPRPGVSLQ